MPLCFVQEIEPTCTFALWQMSETEAELLAQLQTSAVDISYLATIAHTNKRLEFLASRVLLQNLAKQLQITYTGINKDKHGKPYLDQSLWHLSITHSGTLAGIALSRSPVGIDIERPTAKLLHVMPRVLNPTELANVNNQTDKACIYWTAKESLYKRWGQKGVSFKDHLHISPFEISSDKVNQVLEGKLIYGSTIQQAQIYINIYQASYIAVCL